MPPVPPAPGPSFQLLSPSRGPACTWGVEGNMAWPFLGAGVSVQQGGDPWPCSHGPMAVLRRGPTGLGRTRQLLHPLGVASRGRTLGGAGG